MSGKTMPPAAPPVAAMPVARARRARKKWPTEETAGVKMSEVPVPARMPMVRMKCQNSGKVVKVGSEGGEREEETYWC
jgi:hypothetical protein